jgi:hypothetical protein
MVSPISKMSLCLTYSPVLRIRNNANAALVFEFCYRFISIAKSYFGKVDEESVKNNFVLIYELIDGMLFLYVSRHLSDLSSVRNQ